MVIKAVGQLLQAGRFREDEFPATGTVKSSLGSAFVSVRVKIFVQSR